MPVAVLSHLYLPAKIQFVLLPSVVEQSGLIEAFVDAESFTLANETSAVVT